MSVPEDLRDTFALTDYQGPKKFSNSRNQTVFGRLDFQGVEVKSIVQGLAASGVEHGYDGNLVADYGGRLVSEQERFHSSSPPYGY